MPESEPVFISFAAEDRDIADRIAGRLRRDGVGVYQYTELRESGTWHLNQLRALRDSKVAVFVLTENSSASSACLDEAQRVADPTQVNTVPIPLVVGAWDHEGSDLWLLLNKWQGVIASPDLTDAPLHRLADLVHSRLGARPVSSLSTGQALQAVKDDLCAWLLENPGASTERILDEAHAQQLQHRGNMVAFAQFTHLDRELRAADLLPPRARTDYVMRYLQAYFDRAVAAGHAEVSKRLAQRIQPEDVIVISEYSRVIRQAMRVVAETDPALFRSLRFVVVGRTGMLLVDDEPTRMAQELTAMGAQPEIIPFSSWIEYLVHGSGQVPEAIPHVTKFLFGVEAFGINGQIVYPQIVKELDVLRTRRALASPICDAEIIAAGEAFKVCRDPHEISKMIADPHYTVMPPEAVDLILTDVSHTSTSNGPVNLGACVEYVSAVVDEIRRVLWPEESPLPVWNLPSSVARKVTAVASDIDGSVTDQGQRIALRSLERFEWLRASGVSIILTTGRSAGWAAALGHYLPGVDLVLAENGAVMIKPNSTDSAPALLDGWSLDELPERTKVISAAISELRETYTGLTLATDNFTRLTDRTIEVSDEIDPEVVRAIALKYDLRYTYSSVHHHLSVSKLDKATGLRAALREDPRFDQLNVADSLITLGDSINDAPLFDRTAFAASVGVRSVLAHQETLGSGAPRYVTLADASAGFVEFADRLLSHRNGQPELTGRPN